MLGKEKRRARRFLALGAIAASGVFGWQTAIAHREARSVRALVAECERSNAALPKGVIPAPRGGYFIGESEIEPADVGRFQLKHLHTNSFPDVISDPEFKRFQPTEKRESPEQWLRTREGFDKLSPEEQTIVRKHAYRAADLEIDSSLIANLDSWSYWRRAHMLCNPDELEINYNGLEGIQQEIVEASDHVKLVNENARLYAISVFAFFCLPVVWFFLLDRLREVGAAFSGRDQHS